MKKLVKGLALLALVVICLAAYRVGSSKVLGVSGLIPPDHPTGTVCMGDCNGQSTRTTPAQADQDINIELRQFVSVPGTLNIISFQHDTASAPQLCYLFSSQQMHPFTALYAVGVMGGIDSTKSVEQSPPHLAGFQMGSGEAIYAPPLTAYGPVGSDGAGNVFDAIVLYAGTDANGVGSIVLKYTPNDDVVRGYTIDILGINVDSSLQTLYDQANSDGRWYLPGIINNQQIGTAQGTEIWVAIRDTGQFMDPRWYQDWWSGCPTAAPGGAPASSVSSLAHPPGYTTTIATPISTSGPLTTTLNGSGNYHIPSYPPLGQLVDCPQEIPTTSTIASNSDSGGNTDGLNLAKCVGKNIDPNQWYNKASCTPLNNSWPEPACCAQVKASGDPDAGDCVQWALRAWCRPDSCPPTPNQRCGAETTTWASKGSDILKLLGTATTAGGTNAQNLPACVPTTAGGQQCVTECSQPVSITEKLKLYPNSGQDCLRNGDCLININITNPSFNLPFIQQLGDYFSGVLDAEHLSNDQLDKAQTILRAGSTSSVSETASVFQQAGVDRKLLPPDYQDELKYQFIKYVESKKQPNSDGSYPNSKYVGHITVSGKEQLDQTEFMIYDKKVTDVVPPPNVDPNSKYASRANWEKDWGKYWFAVPLFQNDDAQGEIQFVNPSIFSTSELGNNPKYPNVNLGPIYVSLPGTNRLQASTQVLQSAFVSPDLIAARSQAIITDPKNNLPTYGKTINPVTPINACTDTSIDEYYSADITKPLLYDTSGNLLVAHGHTINTKSNPTQPLTDYSRAVTCDIASLDGGGQGTPACVVGPDGQMRCYHQQPLVGSPDKAGTNYNTSLTVQVRTVFPDLFEIAEQTIQSTTGFMRIFKPDKAQTLSQITNGVGNGQTDQSMNSQDVFEQYYAPIPAAVDNVKYLTSDRAIVVDNSKNPNGWQIFLYKLGGLWNAKRFVMQLLNPVK